jgi:hypothetical protein
MQPPFSANPAQAASFAERLGTAAPDCLQPLTLAMHTEEDDPGEILFFVDRTIGVLPNNDCF